MIYSIMSRELRLTAAPTSAAPPADWPASTPDSRPLPAAPSPGDAPRRERAVLTLACAARRGTRRSAVGRLRAGVVGARARLDIVPMLLMFDSPSMVCAPAERCVYCTALSWLSAGTTQRCTPGPPGRRKACSRQAPASQNSVPAALARSAQLHRRRCDIQTPKRRPRPPALSGQVRVHVTTQG